ncbi:hypothetical protein Aple_084820 [Acrocarpospora pleiomorpha]|uniref:Cation/H+ exchanger domain-containing protein n=1 Tax=Acrocarpospora pleiomorpha TaxID=90975 RepID=A0A5M3Y1G5_9ACTN|nr:hypothetical protein [Acrocarpospora pleiomorpha]GES25583.1 hypothetical protein Aple_084820 [Acrocarpospora pleiomorpha]
MVAGLVFAQSAGVGDVTTSQFYLYTVIGLLAIGLYSSASGIPREAVRDLRIVLIAVTLGVLVKAALIAAVMFIVIREPIALVLGIAVAQIDPLSVAAMIGNSRMSPRAKNVLLVWASFDDPITALLVVYLSALALRWENVGGSILDGPGDFWSYLLNLGANLAFAAVCLGIWVAVRRSKVRPAQVLEVVVLLLLLAFAVRFSLLLGVALLGLFYRPAPRLADIATKGAYMLATFALGMLLVAGVAWVNGLALGVAAFGAQMLVAYLITRGMPRADRGYLILSQQNGITAIVLALTLQPSFPETVAIVAPAILIVNVIHIVTTEFWTRHLGAPVPAPREPVDSHS